MNLKDTSSEKHSNIGSKFRDFILGWQDGLVNVLGIILGVAAASVSTKIILISGFAATFAESISMAAVAYTSMIASGEFYNSVKMREKKEIKEVPEKERDEIREIYLKKGFRGKMLDSIVDKISSNKEMWLEIMMKEELGLSPEKMTPTQEAIIVGLSAVVGSLIPLMPFMAFPVKEAIWYSLAISSVVLFSIGLVKSKLSAGKLLKSGAEMVVIGMLAAISGYLIGYLLGVTVT
jgi:VIT1/CCC1 family predicted Fe2+/Mn2+ transporter